MEQGVESERRVVHVSLCHGSLTNDSRSRCWTPDELQCRRDHEVSSGVVGASAVMVMMIVVMKMVVMAVMVVVVMMMEAMVI